jgi:predicted nucleotidyltransferase component of viral defense system
MKLHKNNDEFRAAISATASKLKLPEHVVEKDYWVTQLLQNLSRYEHNQYVIFKGGTCLSKGYKLISRFSEDIDLALNKDGIDIIAKREGDVLHTITRKIVNKSFIKADEGNESEKFRYKRVYEFEKNFEYPEDSPIHGKIILEINSFATPSPAEDVLITSLVAEHLERENGVEVLIELDMEPFTVKALTPERAFCEKILALRRASHREKEFFAARIRHVYDIHQLFHSERIQKFVSSLNEFESMLTRCHSDDELNQKITNDHGGKFIKSEIFSLPNEKINQVRSSYDALKDITFNNELPKIDEVAVTLKTIGKVLGHFEFKNAKAFRRK